MKKFLIKYFWCLGVIFIVAGLVAQLLSPKPSSIPIIFLILGIILLISWLIVLTLATNFWQKRSTQVGTNALISTISVMTIIIVVNFLAFRYNYTLDLTETKIFTLSPQTIETVKKLTQPLKIWVFEDQSKQLDSTLFKEYAKYNSNFQFESVDPNQKLGLAQKFKVENIGDIFIEYGDKKQKLTTLNQDAQLTEIQLTNGISKILQNQSYQIYFIQGHGEPSLITGKGSMTQAVSSLESLGYQVNPLILANETKIPDDCKVLILAGTKRKLLDSEVQLIQEYLDQGGNLLFLIEPQIKTGLETILKNWGVELNLDYIVIDPASEQPPTFAVSFYSDHPITENLNNEISIYDFATPISTVNVEGINAVSLVTTNEETWAENLKNLTENTEITFDEKTDIKAPLDIGIVLTRVNSKSKLNQTKNNQSDKMIESHLIIFGDSSFAIDGLFEQQLNGDIFLNSVKWLVNDQENPLSIRPKEFKNRRLNLTPLQSTIITLLALILFPLFSIILALFTWWKRQ